MTYKIRSTIFALLVFGAMHPQLASAASLTITAPTGAETWLRGSSHTITWTTSGILPTSLTTVALVQPGYDPYDNSKSIGAGFKYFELISQIPNSGSFQATVGLNIPDGVYEVYVANIAWDRKGTITVAPAPTDPTISVTAPVSGSALTKGQPYVLRWATTNADGSYLVSARLSQTNVPCCDLQRATLLQGAANNGSATVVPPTTLPEWSYDLIVTLLHPSGSPFHIASIPVTVVAPGFTGLPPAISLSVNQSSVPRGEFVSLNWSTTFASRCTASGGWSGEKPVSGNETVQVPASTDFILTCFGADGRSASKSASVTATEPIPSPVTVTSPAAGEQVPSPSTYTVRWTTTGISSNSYVGISMRHPTTFGGFNQFVLTTNPRIPNTGSLAVSIPRVQEAPYYQIFVRITDATSGAASGSDWSDPFQIVTVATPLPAPTLTLSASPSSISSGQSSTLTWSSTNATSCTASNGWSGAKSTSGSQSVSPTSNTTFTLS